MYYTNFLVRKEKPMENQQSRNLYQKGYQKFRKEVVAKKQIKYMTELFNQLVQTVEEEEGIDASSFRTFRLKQRLSKSYPQLVFITPKVRNNIEILENLPGRQIIKCLLQSHRSLIKSIQFDNKPGCSKLLINIMLKVYIVHVLVIYNINLQHYMYIVHTNMSYLPIFYSILV